MAGSCLAFQGTLVHTPGKPGVVEVLSDHLIIVNDKGVIVHLGPAGAEGEATLQAHSTAAAAAVHQLGPHQFLLPGFIDTHAHAPQYQYAGVGTDLPLIGDQGWLSTYAFPTEASFRDANHARQIYTACAQKLLRLGTTTANYFTTLHVEGCNVLAGVVKEAGQRAILGKVCMDQNSPESYTEADAATSVQAAAAVVEYIQQLQCSRITPSVIPRFIPTCSVELLVGLGQFAAQHDLHIHSHISESLDQVAFSRQLHPTHRHDADIYNAAGLLTGKAVFAHGTQLSDDALLLLAATGAAVAHCPLSNFYFGDGLFDVVKALNMGVKVGLGTDIAGGYSPSMLQAQRMAVINSHALKAAALMYGTWRQQEQQQQQQQQQEQQEQQNYSQQQPHDDTNQQQQEQQQQSPARQQQQQRQHVLAPRTSAITNPAVAAAAAAHMLTWEDALWLATKGGAAALALQDTIGHFAVGMEFDALVVDAGSERGTFDMLSGQGDPMVMLEQFLNNGDDRNIVEVYVQGKRCV